MTRKNILDSSGKIFSQYGYAAARLEDIAGEAGVTRGAVYWHFKNKADILNNLIIDRFSLMYQIAEEVMNESLDPLQRLKKIIITILTALETNSRFREIIDILLFKVEVVPEIEYQMKEKKAENKRRIDIWQTLIAQAREAGQIRKDIDSYITAVSINCFLEGMITQWLLDPGLFSMKDQAGSMFDMFLNGISIG